MIVNRKIKDYRYLEIAKHLLNNGIDAEVYLKENEYVHTFELEYINEIINDEYTYTIPVLVIENLFYDSKDIIEFDRYGGMSLNEEEDLLPTFSYTIILLYYPKSEDKDCILEYVVDKLIEDGTINDNYTKY